MTTYLGKSCSFGLPRVPFVNCRQFMYLVISLLVLRAGYGIWLYQFLIIAYHFILQIDYFSFRYWSKFMYISLRIRIWSYVINQSIVCHKSISHRAWWTCIRLSFKLDQNLQNPLFNYCNGLKNDPSHWQAEIFSTYYIYLGHQIIHNYS